MKKQTKKKAPARPKEKVFRSLEEIMRHLYPETWQQQLEDMNHCSGCRCERKVIA
jgi:hypothetical protein